jgi:hypothetical protein
MEALGFGQNGSHIKHMRRRHVEICPALFLGRTPRSPFHPEKRHLACHRFVAQIALLLQLSPDRSGAFRLTVAHWFGRRIRRAKRSQ